MDEHLVSVLHPASFEAEQYRVLRHVVETQRRDAKLQVVGVTSPGVGDGKTTTAINLAGALAQASEARVLLVDLDLRRPSVARQLGLAASARTLDDALQEPSPALEGLVRDVPFCNLSVLPARGGLGAPYEALKSPGFEMLLEEARRRYDYVVLDTPPFVPVPDGRVIAGSVDGFLVVVSADRTPRGMLAEMLALMEPGKVVGIVFNGARIRRSSYSYYDPYPPEARSASPWRRLARGAGRLKDVWPRRGRPQTP